MTTDVSERGLEHLIVADMTGGQRTRLHGWCINWSGSQATPARCFDSAIVVTDRWIREHSGDLRRFIADRRRRPAPL